ncbi:MAG: hypothetical protein SEPTF4163_001817 [Sporothrix epigloea]
MRRYACESLLTFRASLEDRVLVLNLRHSHHAPYSGTGLPPEALEFINSRTASQTSAEIYHSPVAEKLTGVDRVTTQQVYYFWWKANKQSGKQMLESCTGNNADHECLSITVAAHCAGIVCTSSSEKPLSLDNDTLPYRPTSEA